MELIKLLKRPKHPVQTTKVERVTNHEDVLDFTDIERHITQYKRCCTSANNKDLKRIELEVESLLSQVQ